MKSNDSNSYRHWWLPVLSGLLIGTSYIPFPPWASLFGFVPLWLFWQRQSRCRDVFYGGLITAAVFSLIGFNWVTYLLHEFGHLDWPFAVLGMVGFALLAHLYVPVAGVLWYWGHTRLGLSGHRSATLMALITAVCEANSVTLFDWNFGYTWYGSSVPVYHWAEFIGFSGLSAATVLTNLTLLHAWQMRSTRQGWVLLATVLLGFGLLNLGGIWLKGRLPTPDAHLRAALIQGNYGNLEAAEARFGADYQATIIKHYLKLTDDALQTAQGKVDFALWPETGFPALLGEPFKSKRLPLMLKSYLADHDLALITGAYSADLDSGLPTNSLFLLDRNGEITSPHYSKTILLAFGEYLPGEALFPWLRDLLPQVGQFARGQGPSLLLKLGELRIGPQICYESLFPWFSRALSDLGAQVIVNVTNDAWYGDWQEPYQHMYMTLARGVEFRRPVLRVTNTGISTVALASGEILQRSPLGQPWSGIYDVPFIENPTPTFYQRFPWLIPAVLWGNLIALIALGLRRHNHRNTE